MLETIEYPVKWEFSLNSIVNNCEREENMKQYQNGIGTESHLPMYFGI